MATRRTFIGSSLAAGWLATANSSLLAQTPSDPTRLSLRQASYRIRARELSPVELTQAYLDRIEALNPRLNAYITVTGELALEQARAREAELTRGQWRGPLHGIPIGLKDNIDTAGIRTTAAGALFAERIPRQDAPIYQRLLAAGAILLGKLNMHEYAYGGTSAISHFGPVHNPWNEDHIAGGSSGGSAVAVAARLCCAALGTDTLASVRLPAAYNGIVGFKPSHGLSSIRGIIPVAESLDTVGPMTGTVADSALLLQAMAGYDPLDPMSLAAEPPSYASALFKPVRTLRLGIAQSPFWDNLQEDVATATSAALTVLEQLSAGSREVELPAAADFSVLLAEAYAYHREYLEQQDNHDLYDPVTLERLLAAGEVSTDVYYEGRRQLTLSRQAITSVFDEVDLLITPTTPGLPETLDQARNPAEASGAEDSVRNLVPFNIYGIPSLSLPCGYSRNGLPIGLQISGPRLGEIPVLSLAHAFEQVTDWHERQPPLA